MRRRSSASRRSFRSQAVPGPCPALRLDEEHVFGAFAERQDLRGVDVEAMPREHSGNRIQQPNRSVAITDN